MTLKLPDNKDEALEMAEYAVEGLNIITQLVGGAGAATAAGVIAIIRVVISTLKDGFEGKIDAKRVREDLARLHASISGNDAGADAALKDKFDTSDNQGSK